MRLGPLIYSAIAVLLAGTLSYFSATMAADMIETGSGRAVQEAMLDADHGWVEVTTDGLQVQLRGTAPTEADRFRALSTAGSVVDSARVIDAMEVQAAEPLAPPRFSIEVLRNDAGVSLIGLIPEEVDREALAERIRDIVGRGSVSDLLETAKYPVPDGWDDALDFGLEALGRLPRSKISIGSGQVSVSAIAESNTEKRKLEADLARTAPEGLRLALNISAPRPVITPFTLRFLIDATGRASFDACSADSESARARIVAAAREAGIEDKIDCTLGLGAPTPDWADGAVLAIRTLTELGGGSVTMSDADVSLVALDTTPQRDFDRAVGTLESNLPDVFSLTSLLPEPVAVDGTGEAETGPPEFVATRSPEGQVQLRGRLPDDQVRTAVESFARARFGTDNIYAAARVAEGLPPGWPVRVLAGLQALSELANGSVVVQPDYIELRGQTGNPDARAEIARLLSEKLGEGQNFSINVTYLKKLDPLAELPTAAECIEKIDAILLAEKITFEPSSADIAGPGSRVMDQIADVLKACAESELKLEIGGHTDSQGREIMNLELSQARADAVLEALVQRRVLTTHITARGYGETIPIAENDTEEGREANRRIEFRQVVETTEEEAASEGAEETSEDASSAAATEDSGAPGRPEVTPEPRPLPVPNATAPTDEGE